MFIIRKMPKYNQYYKAKTRRIGVLQYRKYVIGMVAGDSENHNSNSKKLLEMDIYNSYPDKLYSNKKNHPLVNKGLAFWVNKTYICIGYDIDSVFRPIFDHRRESLVLGVRKDIVKYAKILVSNARHALYKKELMKLHNKKIPEVLVDYIANYAWDIMLLL
jgi:hypothetical protein